jgi:hypothetical protein
LTSYKIIIDKFIKQLKDPDFLYYAELSDDEVNRLVEDDSVDLINQAVDELMFNGEGEYQVNFFDKDDILQQFNFTLNSMEIALIVNLMIEKYYERNKVKLKAFENFFSTKELNTFSPANERDSYIEMCNDIESKNRIKINKYKSIDRETGKLKELNFDLPDNGVHYELRY